MPTTKDFLKFFFETGNNLQKEEKRGPIESKKRTLKTYCKPIPFGKAELK
jgi:hypothetical protein